MSRRQNLIGGTLLLVVLLLPLSSWGSEGDEPQRPDTKRAELKRLDLRRVVQLTLAGNPALKAIEERRSEVEAAIREARGEAFPELALVAFWGRSRNPAFLNSPDFESFLDGLPDGVTFRPGTQELYHLAVELRQALYTGGKVSAAVDVAEAAASIADAQIRLARLDAAAAAAEAFYNWLSARSSLATLEIQQAVREEALAVVEARFELGDATRLEQLRARAALAAVKPTVARVEGDVEVAKQELRAILDLAPGTPIEPLALTAEPQVVTEEVDDLLRQALERRPELADLDLQDEVLALRDRIEGAEARPQVDLTGSFGREARLIEDLSEQLFDDWRLSVNLRWEFFDGGKRRGRQAQLASQRRQVEWQRRDLVQRVRLEIERSLSAYRAAWESWQATEIAAQTAREASRVAAESYSEGVALQADLLDAQQQEVLAELQRVQAYFEVWSEAARLDRAVGRLPGRGRSPQTEATEDGSTDDDTGPQATAAAEESR